MINRAVRVNRKYCTARASERCTKSEKRPDVQRDPRYERTATRRFASALLSLDFFSSDLLHWPRALPPLYRCISFLFVFPYVNAYERVALQCTLRRVGCGWHLPISSEYARAQTFDCLIPKFRWVIWFLESLENKTDDQNLSPEMRETEGSGTMQVFVPVACYSLNARTKLASFDFSF